MEHSSALEKMTTMGRLRAAVLFISLPFGALMFVLPIIGRDMGASAVEIGGLYSAFSLMTVLLRPIVGRALDRFGRKPFLLGGLAAYSLANLLYAAAGNVEMLYLARIAQGLGSGLLWLTAYAMVADLAGEKERGGLFGHLEEMSARGAVLGVLVVFGLMGYWDDKQGWQVSFHVFALIGLATLAFAWRTIRETKPAVAAAPATVEITSQERWAHLRETLTFPLIVLLVIVFLTASAYALTGPVLMIYLKDHLASDITALALAFMPAAIVYATLPSRLGRLSDRWGRRLPMALALAVGGIVSFAIPYLRSLWPLVLLWAAEAVCFSAATPAEEALVADLSPGAHHGLAYGLYTAAASLGSVVGPLLGGWLYEQAGAASPFYANAGLLWLGMLGIALVLRVPK